MLRKYFQCIHFSIKFLFSRKRAVTTFKPIIGFPFALVRFIVLCVNGQQTIKIKLCHLFCVGIAQKSPEENELNKKKINRPKKMNKRAHSSQISFYFHTYKLSAPYYLQVCCCCCCLSLLLLFSLVLLIITVHSLTDSNSFLISFATDAIPCTDMD